MVDITNRDPSLLPMREDLDLNQQLAEAQKQPAQQIDAQEQAVLNQSGKTQEANPQETAQKAMDQTALSEKFIRSRRSFNTNAMRDQLAARLQTNKAAAPVGDQASSKNFAAPLSERDQIKAAIASKFPEFSALPAAVQNMIAELFLAEPRLAIDNAMLFIQLAETASFQRLGAGDRQLLIKLLGSLVLSPQFADPTDGRLAALIGDIVRGVIDLRIYRGTEGEPGRSEATGFALNLSSPDVATAIAAALKGDGGKLSSILLALDRSMPDARSGDPLWNMLSARADFRALGDAQNAVYQTLKLSPDADVDRLIEHIAYPLRAGAKQTAFDRAGELNLIAAAAASKETQSLLDTVSIGVYRAGDGKKSIVDRDSIRLNAADPSVQRSLNTDGKLAAAALARLGADALRSLDHKVAELDSNSRFKKLDRETKRMIAGAVNEYPKAGVEELARFAESQGFADIAEKHGRERAYTMRFIASLLHQYENDPKRMMMVYQSLQRLFNNDIKFLEFMQESGYEGTDEGGAITINPKHSREDESAAVSVKEVDRTASEKPEAKWGGTVALFASEYKAAYADELYRANETPKPEHMRQVMNGLFNAHPSSVFAHLPRTYQSDETFAQLVDWINEQIGEDRVPSPEELRQALLGMVGKTPNIGSADNFEESWVIDLQTHLSDGSIVRS